jgi:hypothetical protein
MHSHAFEKQYYMHGMGPHLNLDGITHHLNTSTTCNRHSPVVRERVLRSIIADIPLRKANDKDRREDGYLADGFIAELLYALDNEAAIKADDSTLQDLEKGKDSLKKLQSAVIVTQSQRIFWSKHNRMGLTSKGCRAGDSILLIHGCKTPFVCRPYQERWIPISQCYLEGVMYGEAVNWKENEAKKLELV